jgi:hypothetical protein
MIRAHAPYANLARFPTLAKGAAARKAAAATEALAEARLKAKVDQANRVLDALAVRQERFVNRAKDWTQQAKLAAAASARLEDAILRYMDEQGLAQLAGTRTSLRAQPTPAALEVCDATLIPAPYWRQPKTPPREPDKVALKKAIAETADLDPAAWGCRLTTRDTLVRQKTPPPF